MNVKPPEKVLRKPVTTWLSDCDYLAFKTIAEANGVTVASYLRGIVVDVINEETNQEARPVVRTAVGI